LATGGPFERQGDCCRVVATNPSIADWTVTAFDPKPLVWHILARSDEPESHSNATNRR
jgi:hypothetical protein